MKNWDYSFYRNLLETPSGRVIRLPAPLRDHLALKNIWIAVLGRHPDRVMNENVMAFDVSGDMAWQIEKRPEVSGSYSFKYESIDKTFSGDKLIKIRNWNHYDAYMDTATGEIKELIDNLPGWKVDGRLILCPNRDKIEMRSEIEKYDLFLDNLLVLLQPFRGSGGNNVFLISTAGRVIWQVAPVRAINGDSSTAYVDYSELSKDKKTIKLFTFGGTINTIDINTGKSLNTHWTK